MPILDSGSFAEAIANLRRTNPVNATGAGVRIVGEKKMNVWFDIGQKIKDGEGKEHPMTVCAYNEVQYNEYLKKGWKPVEAKPTPPVGQKIPVISLTGKRAKRNEQRNGRKTQKKNP